MVNGCGYKSQQTNWFSLVHAPGVIKYHMYFRCGMSMKALVSGAWTTTMHLCFAVTSHLMAQNYSLVMLRDQWRYICMYVFMLHTHIDLFSIQIWSLTTRPGGRLLNDLALHVDWVNCVLYSPSGRHILSAGDNGLIKVKLMAIYKLMSVHLWILPRSCGMKMKMRVRSSQSWMDHSFHTTTEDLLSTLKRIPLDMSPLLCATFLKIQGYRYSTLIPSLILYTVYMMYPCDTREAMKMISFSDQPTFHVGLGCWALWVSRTVVIYCFAPCFHG